MDLSVLPKPAVVEELDYEVVLAATVATLNQHFAAAGIGYDVGGLETDPIKVNCEINAYREILVRARINDAARANLLYFATAGDLDHLASFYDVTRMLGETDERLKRRVILAIEGRSPGGTAPRYASVAMTSSLRVADAVVYRVGTSPLVHIAVFSTDNGGVADSALLTTVRAAVNAPAVRMVSDTLDVTSAIFRTIAVEADIWLLPETPDTILPILETQLRAAWEAAKGLGFDMTRSWLSARLMMPSVHHVEILAPTQNEVAAPQEALAMGTITLHNRGRDF